jgi:hypothetical protein
MIVKGKIYKDSGVWVIKYDNPTYNIDGVRVKSLDIHPEDVDDLIIIDKHAGYNEIKGEEFNFEIKKEWINDELFDYAKLVWSDSDNNSPETWSDIHAEYIKDASEEYIYFIDWLRKNYNTPIKK